MKRDLLEELAKLNHCYISDLRNQMKEVNFINSVENIKAADYTFSEWAEVTNYLCGRTPEIKDVVEIQHLLVNCLRNKLC
ncbi:MAG: hypothetical protein RSB19_05410 [Erysipelotrichaceae bacterium]